MAVWNIQVPNTEYYGPLPFNPRGVTNRDLGPLIRELEDWRTVEIAIDTETTGLIVFKEQVLYWSLAWGNRRCTLHASMLPYFRHIFEDPNKIWIFANAKFDMHMMSNMGIHFKGKIYCTQVMHSLLFEEQSHRLKDMAKHLLGWRWSDFQDTFGRITKQNTPLMLMQKAEAENFPLLCEYASNDAWGTIGVKRDLEPRLKSAYTHSLFREIPPYIDTLWDLFSKVEAPYTRVLWKNERNGILLDREYFEKIRPLARYEIEQLEQRICKQVGWRMTVSSTADLKRYFFDQMRYPPFKMTSGGKSGNRSASTDADTIQHMFDEYGDPVAKMILEHKNLTKLESTYIHGISEFLDAHSRIHTRFNQDVTRCMPAGELVLTNRGYLPVEHVVVGDKVIAHTGRVQSVVEISQHAPQPIYRVRLENGLTLRTTGNHKYKTSWDTWTRADELHPGMEVTIHSNPEEWKTIRGWPSFEVSSWGRIRNIRTGHVLSQQPKGRWGHLKVCLHRNGAQKRGPDRKDFSVHRLVLRAFVATSAEETRHLNGISWDNTVGNLAYGTSSENRQDAIRHGTMSQRRAGRSILTESDVEAIRRASSPGQPASSTSKFNYVIAQEIRGKYPAQNRRQLAEEYETSYASIDNIIKGKTWTKAPVEQRTAEEWAELYGISAGVIRSIWAGRRWLPEEGISEPKASFATSRVSSITLESQEFTYGLTVENDHSHVTGGIVTHNTGRLSSSDPNLQNIPNVERDKWKLRSAFIAPKGKKLIVADYNQLEMRLLAAAAREKDMIDIFLRNWDIHMGNASMMMNIPYDEIKAAKKIDGAVKEGKLPESALTSRVLFCLHARAAAKNIGFGLNYGMGANKLANDLGISAQEAIAKIATYKQTYPAVTKFYEEAVNVARQTGYSFTILGRRRNLPGIASSRRDERARAERQAINVEIQGSAADLMKMAQIMLDRAELDRRFGCYSLLNIHDELIHECPDETIEPAMKEIKEWMEQPFVIDFDVPLTIAMGKAQNWQDAK